MKKWILLFSGGILLAAVSVSAFTQVSVKKQIFTERVDIRLEELTQQEDERKIWVDGIKVMPGMTVSKIPRIYNDGADCYVRAAVEFSGGEQTGQTLSMEQLTGISGDWIRKGDWFYYAEILPAGTYTDFFSGISIPDTWEQQEDPDGAEWTVTVRADAIQAAHILPDFFMEDPWSTVGDYTVETAEHTGAVSGEAPGPSFTGTVTLDEETRGLLADPDVFLEDFGGFLPGDTQTRTVMLRNSTDEYRELYIQISAIAENQWMKDMELKVAVEAEGGQNIFAQGSLQDDRWRERRKLCGLAPGEQVSLEITISMPEQLGNAYAAQTGEVELILSSDRSVQPAVTNDRSSLRRWCLMAGSAGIAAVGIPVVCRRKKDGRYKNIF